MDATHTQTAACEECANLRAKLEAAEEACAANVRLIAAHAATSKRNLEQAYQDAMEWRRRAEAAESKGGK